LEGGECPEKRGEKKESGKKCSRKNQTPPVKTHKEGGVMKKGGRVISIRKEEGRKGKNLRRDEREKNWGKKSVLKSMDEKEQGNDDWKHALKKYPDGKKKKREMLNLGIMLGCPKTGGLDRVPF